MNAGKSITTRQPPTQPRAKASVDRILNAARKMIGESGSSGLTTNHIADQAGVNISTLYRYFPNKEAIWIMLYEQSSARIASIMRARLAEHSEEDLATGMPNMLDQLLTLFEEESLVILTLPQKEPALREIVEIYSYERLIYGTARIYYRQHLQELDGNEIDSILFISINNILANIHRFILDRPEGMSRSSFIKELSTSTVAYVTQRKNLH